MRFADLVSLTFFQIKVNVDEELAERMLGVMDKYREAFFVVDLKYDVNKIRIVDTDPNISSEIMDGRDSFLL
jgi:hypothetical protein